MEILPLEIIKSEIFLWLDCLSFLNFYHTCKMCSRLGNQVSFWESKVLSISRSELQNNWLLLLSKEGKVRLLYALLAATEQKKIIIDKRLICYATLYLLERKEGYTRTSKELIDALIIRVESDPFLISELQRIQKVGLLQFLHHIKLSVDNFKHEVSIGREPSLEIAKAVTLRNLGVYLKEYAVDYFYRHTDSIIPPLKSHADLLKRMLNENKLTHASLIFRSTAPLVSYLIKYNRGISQVRELLEYINKDEELKNAHKRLQLAISYYNLIFLSILEEGTYDEAISLSMNDQSWRPYSPVCPTTPKDPEIYYKLAHIYEYNPFQLVHAYRCLEPEEYIKYLQKIVNDKFLTHNSMMDLLKLSTGLEQRGFTYFALVSKQELEKLSRVTK